MLEKTPPHPTITHSKGIRTKGVTRKKGRVGIIMGMMHTYQDDTWSQSFNTFDPEPWDFNVPTPGHNRHWSRLPTYFQQFIII